MSRKTMEVTRKQIMAGDVPDGATFGGSLYLSGCDLKGITLPTSVGGYLDLSGTKGLHAKDAADFCRLWELPMNDGVVVLFKAVNDVYMSEKGGDYTPGTIPVAHDWDGGKSECGGGLHFCATPAMAKTFNRKATRFVACPIKLADIATHAKAEYPHKVKARGCCWPTWEVDINGKAIKAKAKKRSA